MNVRDMNDIERVGALVDVQGNTDDCLRRLVALANRIESAGLRLKAESSSSAAAWLLCAADANAGGQVGTCLQLPSIVQGRLLGFRGQKGVFSGIVPSLYRLPEQERGTCRTAFHWFHAAISAWHNEHFRYRNGEYDGGGVEFEAALGVAQHYQLPTYLVDWTWDPLVAMAFAMADLGAGDQGVVLLRDFGAGMEPSGSYNVLLPSTFAERAWRQRALFSWETVPPEDRDNPWTLAIAGNQPRLRGSAESYYRVAFSADEEDIRWANEMRAALMAEIKAPKLGDLAGWCQDAARRSRQVTFNCRLLAVDDFRRRCEEFRLRLPDFFAASTDVAATEDIGLMMDYLDAVAARRDPSDGHLKYYLPALLTACVATPWCSWMHHAYPEGEGLDDPRATVFFEHGRPLEDSWSQKLRFVSSAAEIAGEARGRWLEQLHVERPS